MGIETIIGMIPKGGRYAKSVVNFVHKTVDDWPKFKEAIKQITDLLKIGKLRLDGKQKTIFESNKNILKNHEKVTKKVEVPPSVKKEFPPFNISKTDPFKGWTPTLIERSRARNIYKELEPPKAKYTKEMEAIDEELDALAFGGEKYEGLSSVEKAAIFKKLQAEMKQLMVKGEDLSTLSLSQINKKSQNLQKRIREIIDNPNIKGTVTTGPKRDMIKALYDSENTALTDARKVITKRNFELKYGDKFPRLDPENDVFIITGLDEFGHPNKVSRFRGRFSATQSPHGELTRKEGTAWWDTWDTKKNQMRKKGEEVWHETVDREGKVIMSNPDYQLPKTENMELSNELYTNLSTSDLAKKGYTLKQIDMIVKGRKVREYLEKTKSKDTSISMHEQTSTNEIEGIMEDLYHRSDDIYKMSIEEWITKIPEHFAQGGNVPGFATGGISNLFRERQGYRDPGRVIQLAKGARWLIRMLKEMMDDMIYGQKQFAKMAESLKMKYFKQTEAAVKSLESGNPIPDEILTSMRNDPRFKGLTVSKTADKDFIEIQEVVLGKLPKGKGEIIEGKAVEKVELSKYTDKDLNALATRGNEIKKQMDVIDETGTTTVPYKELQKELDEIDKILTEAQKVPESGYSNFKADLALEKQATKGKGEIIEGKEVEVSGIDDLLKSDFENLKLRTKGTGEKILEGKVVEEIDLMAFKKTLPKELIDKLNALPVENQTSLLLKFKEAFEAAQKGGVEGGVEVLQKELLEGFIPKGKPHATGGLIDGYATGGVSNLFRQRQGFRLGNVAKLPEFLKFVERLLIKASNQIRRGQGKWKGLDIKQKIVQHDNLTKLVTEFQKTKKFNPGMNEYFGIDAEKAFIEAQSKVKKPKVKDEFYSKKDMEKEWEFENKLAKQEMKQEDQMIDKALSGMDELQLLKIKYPGISDDLLKKILIDDNPQRKAEVLATMDEYLKLREVGKGEEEAFDIITRSFSKTPTKHASGGLIPGYATGGVSNLFRRR